MLPAGRISGLSNHGVLVSRNIGTAGVPQIENPIYIGARFRTSKITCYQAAEVFRQRYAEISCTSAGTPLHLGFERNLGS